MRPQSPVRRCLVGVVLTWSAFACVPASAETLAELDTLSDLSANERDGIAAARAQAGRGEYLEALATLERVLAAYPESSEGRLIHAIYLCEIDDKRGGLVEIDKLKEKDYGKQLLAEARARCGNGGGR